MSELSTLAAHADALSLPSMRFVREDMLNSSYGAQAGYYAAKLNEIGSAPDGNWTYLGKDLPSAKQALHPMAHER